MSAERTDNGDTGFTLVEALVGLLLVSALAAGVGHLLVMTLTATRDAREATSAVLLASQKLEALLALAVSDAGLSASPGDTLDTDTPGHVDVVDTAGQDVPSLSAPRYSPVYTRRWRVSPLSSDPSRLWLVQVRVMTLSRAAMGETMAANGARVPGDVLLTTVKRRP